MLDLRDMGKADPPVVVGVRSQIDQVHDIIHLPDPVFLGQLKDLEFDLMAADIDRTK